MHRLYTFDIKHTTLSLEIVKDVQRKQADEIQTTLTRWKQNNLQLEQMKLAIAPIINALAEALNILAWLETLTCLCSRPVYLGVHVRGIGDVSIHPSVWIPIAKLGPYGIF